PAYAGLTVTLAGLIEAATLRDAAAKRHLEQGGRLYAGADFYYMSVLNDWAFGVARALTEDTREATSRLTHAAARASAMGAQAIEALLLPDLVEVRAAVGDLSGASESAERSQVLAESLGTTVASAHASYARGIVALVRSGLANRDIAERLHVSERTVETHLAHVYGKLGVASRRELVQG